MRLSALYGLTSIDTDLQWRICSTSVFKYSQVLLSRPWNPYLTMCNSSISRPCSLLSIYFIMRRQLQESHHSTLLLLLHRTSSNHHAWHCSDFDEQCSVAQYLQHLHNSNLQSIIYNTKLVEFLSSSFPLSLTVVRLTIGFSLTV